MAVQSQGLVSDASRLSQLLDQQMDRLIETRTMLLYLMVGLFGAFFLASYVLTYRRILKSIVTLQAGAALIGSGNLDFVIQEKRNDEIGDLSRAFNQMTINLKAVTASKADLEKEIVGRKRAEEDLRRQREWLHVTLGSIGDAVIASDTDGRITFLNPVAITLTGWQLEETLGQPIQGVFRIINEKTHAPAEDLVARVLTEKRVVDLANDTALVTKDGRQVPIEDSAAPILDSAGNVIGVVLVFHDVTEKRRAQARLREALERAVWLARFPEQNPNPIIRASADGTVLYCNPASANLHGWTCEVGQVLQNELLSQVGRAMAEGMEVQEDIQLDGRFYIVWVVPFPGEGYANVYGRDITARKRAEEALRESEQRYRELVQNANSAIIRWKSNGTVTFFNEYAQAFFGYSAEEAIGEHVNIILPKKESTGGDLTTLAQDIVNHPERYERNVNENICRDGRRVWMAWTNRPIFDRNGQVAEILAVGTDITERKQAEEALRQRTLELQQLTEALEHQVQERTEELEVANEELKVEIDECQRVEIELKKSESGLRHLSLELLNAQEKERKLVAGEIHDSIGSSLSAIKFKVENALTEVADKSPETTTVLQSVIPIVQGAIDEARRIQMNLRPSVLDDLGILATIRWFCRQFESTYSRIRISQDIKIEEHQVPGPLKTVIFRVLQEGLNNIAKHSQAKMVMLLLRKTGQGVQLIVRDNGQGFDLSKVQSPNGTAQGLGLTNMGERTELSGGSFKIESTQGKGTTIRASWPI